MSVQSARLIDEEPPSTRAQQIVGKASQYVLHCLCAAAVAVFPVGLAYKLLVEFLP